MATGTGDGFSVRVDGVGTVRVFGEVDFACAAELQASIEAAAAATDGDVVVDLAEVSFIDSAGMNVFVRCFKPLDAQGRTIALRGTTPTVRRALELGGLTTFLPVH